MCLAVLAGLSLLQAAVPVEDRLGRSVNYGMVAAQVVVLLLAFVLSAVTVILSMRTVFQHRSWVAATSLLSGVFTFLLTFCMGAFLFILVKMAVGFATTLKGFRPD
jgi:hypothetical protein